MAEKKFAIAIPDEVTEDDDEEAPPGEPLWLITFGDSISLLLTFFVLLLSFSTFDDPNALKNIISFHSTKLSTGKALVTGKSVDQRNTRLQDFLNRVKGTLTFKHEVIKDDIQKATTLDNVTFTLEQLEELIQENLHELTDALGAEKQSSFLITFDPGIYFMEGTDEMDEPSLRILKNTLPLLGSIPNDIVVNGYSDDPLDVTTDKLLLARKELAIRRADRVVQFVTHKPDIPPERVSIGVPVISEGKTKKKSKENMKKVTMTVLGSLEGFYALQMKEQTEQEKNG